MRSIQVLALAALMLLCNLSSVYSQKKGLESISIPELNAHISFLASDELKGRDTGDPGLMIAARYLASQAELIGLKPLDEDMDYYQNYAIVERGYDLERSQISVRDANGSLVSLKNEFFMLPPGQNSETFLEGEVVFAGYGIHAEAYDYNDLENIVIEDKIVMIMNRAPLDEEGNEFLFEDDKWGSMQNFQYKIQLLASKGPKAILLVMDPKSGFNSISDMNPRVSNYLSKSRGLKKDDEGSGEDENMKIVMIHRHVADALLDGSGTPLDELQAEIDRNLKPNSFLIKDKEIKVELYMVEDVLIVPNIFGYIEGSDPVLKDEMLIYSAHYDHVGYNENGDIYNGADDNASGSVALLEIAEAFLKEKKMPKRSVGFLWVSAEEIGLYGSEYYAGHPLYDIEKTVAAINLDMVSRRKTEADISSGRRSLTIVDGDSVKVIGGLQSSVLMEINKQTLAEMDMQGEYKYNDRTHPERYFFRSDHINFVKKDIPVLFYSTGTHKDYHQAEDNVANIDFDKFLKMTRFSFKAGYNVANYKDEIVVDNPFSTWE